MTGGEGWTPIGRTQDGGEAFIAPVGTQLPAPARTVSRLAFRWRPNEPVAPERREEFAAFLVGKEIDVTGGDGAPERGRVRSAEWGSDGPGFLPDGSFGQDWYVWLTVEFDHATRVPWDALIASLGSTRTTD